MWKEFPFHYGVIKSILFYSILFYLSLCGRNVFIVRGGNERARGPDLYACYFVIAVAKKLSSILSGGLKVRV